MSYMLDAVALCDREHLVRYCDHLAMQGNPLTKTMFPKASPETQDEEIRWYVDSFGRSLEKDPTACFRKVCTHDSMMPRSLDTCAWRAMSQKLTSERRRVLKDVTKVWSKSIFTPILNRCANDRP